MADFSILTSQGLLPVRYSQCSAYTKACIKAEQKPCLRSSHLDGLRPKDVFFASCTKIAFAGWQCSIPRFSIDMFVFTRYHAFAVLRLVIVYFGCSYIFPDEHLQSSEPLVSKLYTLRAGSPDMTWEWDIARESGPIRSLVVLFLSHPVILLWRILYGRKRCRASDVLWLIYSSAHTSSHSLLVAFRLSSWISCELTGM